MKLNLTYLSVGLDKVLDFAADILNTGQDLIVAPLSLR
jgi:hypothetical protein